MRFDLSNVHATESYSTPSERGTTLIGLRLMLPSDHNLLETIFVFRGNSVLSTSKRESSNKHTHMVICRASTTLCY